MNWIRIAVQSVAQNVKDHKSDNTGLNHTDRT